MYLGCYSFDGEPEALTAGYERLNAAFPPDSIDLRVVVLRADGLDVYDACPDEATFQAFSTSAEFAAALAGCGLPAPRIAGLGAVHAAALKQPVG